MHNGHKKLLFIIDNLSTGGAQRQLIQLAVGLKHLDYHVDIFCYQEGNLLAQPLYDEGIDIFWQVKKSRYSPDVIFAINKLIKKMKYNLVISFLPTPNFYAIVCCRFMGHRIPVIVSERRADFPTGPSRNEKLARSLYRYADHLVVNSYHQRDFFHVNYPLLKDRTTTIYNGFELNKFIAPFTLPENDILRILVIASVGPQKNGLCLVEALRIVREKYDLSPSVDWIGQQIQTGEYGAYLREMNEKIKMYSLNEQWNWLGQRTDVIEQMHQHDVLIHPSYLEGLPNVVCEALASSLPVIVSNTLDHPLLIQDHESGFLFDYHDPEDLAEKIVEFNNLNQEQRRHMGYLGNQYAIKNLSSERFVSSYKDLIDLVIRDF